MIHLVYFFLTALLCYNATAQILVTEVAIFPERVSNNAVCEGFIEGSPYIFSFGGIDSTKAYTGIHLRSYRHNIQTGKTIQIPDLPDTLGKIAAGANRIGNIIYIAGGYHVLKSGKELSSSKMHRYDIRNNIFLADGKDIPLAVDDHVQAVWRDSLIFVITGWSNKANVPDVQIYNPATDSWMKGDSTPDNNNYKSFGASGIIHKDTIYYFGGASSARGFDIQNQLRKGVINPNAPTEIDWSITTPDPAINGYRMAATQLGNKILWIGGSNTTYNYDGIAYNKTGGVSPANRILSLTKDRKVWEKSVGFKIPMDLRGIANVSDTVKYLIGGMINDQAVSNKIYKLESSAR